MVTKHAISSILVQERVKTKYSMYYMSQLLHGAEKRYPVLEKAAHAIVTLA